MCQPLNQALLLLSVESGDEIWSFAATTRKGKNIIELQPCSRLESFPKILHTGSQESETAPWQMHQGGCMRRKVSWLQPAQPLPTLLTSGTWKLPYYGALINYFISPLSTHPSLMIPVKSPTSSRSPWLQLEYRQISQDLAVKKYERSGNSIGKNCHYPNIPSRKWHYKYEEPFS